MNWCLICRPVKLRNWLAPDLRVQQEKKSSPVAGNPRLFPFFCFMSQCVDISTINALFPFFCPQHFNSAFVRIRKLAQYPTAALDVCRAIISREVFTFSFLESNTCAEYGVPQVSSFWSIKLPRISMLKYGRTTGNTGCFLKLVRP